MTLYWGVATGAVAEQPEFDLTMNRSLSLAVRSGSCTYDVPDMGPTEYRNYLTGASIPAGSILSDARFVDFPIKAILNGIASNAQSDHGGGSHYAAGMTMALADPLIPELILNRGAIRINMSVELIENEEGY